MILALAFVLAAAGCGRSLRQVLPSTVSSQPALHELWVDPATAPRGDLFYGPGGRALAPNGRSFVFVAADTSGFSDGYDVKDAAGLEWSVKLGPEAQSEVTVSRILWAIGYHQPPTYYLAGWTLTGAQSGEQQPGRFRPKLEGHEVVGDWSWYENPFVGTRPYRGLVVANLILNSWDWKTSNNKIYQLDTPMNGVSRWFVVRDLGASLGKFSYPTILKWFRLRGFGQGTRNNLADFEQQGFIKSIDRERGEVEFDYRGIYRDVIGIVTPDDVRWACDRLSRLTDAQWRDAFRAAGYSDADGTRFTTKIKEKIAQGLQRPPQRAKSAR